jgi:hypothetical protein
VEACRIARLLKALNQSTFPNVINMRSPVILRSAMPGETMSRENDRMFIARQHVFNFFGKGSLGDRHSLTREFNQSLFPFVSALDSAATRHDEREIVGARLQISIDIAATECRVSFPDFCLEWIGHGPNSITIDLLKYCKIYRYC